PPEPLPSLAELRGHTATIQGVTGSPVIVDAPSETDGIPQYTPSIVTPSTGVPRAANDRPRERHVAVALRKGDSAPIATTGRDSPPAVVRAREVLVTAEDRDTVFITLLRAARTRARFAALLTVQGGAAIGRVALAEPGIDVTAVQRVLIPLDAMSPF